MMRGWDEVLLDFYLFEHITITGLDICIRQPCIIDQATLVS